MTTKTIAKKISAKAAAMPLPAGVGELNIKDTELVGFRLRITPRAKRYVFAGRVKGGQRRTVILGDADSMTAAQARTAAMEVRSRFLTGDDFVAVKKPDTTAMTFDECADTYERLWSAGKLRRQKRIPRPETIKSHGKDIARARAAFGALPVSEIDLNAARTFTARLEAEDISIQWKGKSFGAARRVLDYALDTGVIDMNVFRVMPGFTTGEARDRYLSATEVAKVWDAAEAMGTHTDFCRFMMAQPLRLSLGLNLDWKDVDLDNGTMFISADAEGNKSRKPWRLPLSPIAQGILNNLYNDQAAGLVFHHPDGSALDWRGYHINKWRSVSGVDGWSIHDLRRTATSLPAERFENYDEDLGDLWLMHLRQGVKGTYQRASRVEPMRAPARMWAQVLGEITGQTVTSNVVAL